MILGEMNKRPREKWIEWIIIHSPVHRLPLGSGCTPTNLINRMTSSCMLVSSARPEGYLRVPFVLLLYDVYSVLCVMILSEREFIQSMNEQICLYLILRPIFLLVLFVGLSLISSPQSI
ncbi:hypothetical protein B0H34DRAFT_477756 [Crassisporium funariophilum]|nr:hypothetical protein B0H34DRAFT_477756 [Crassisporium funariophilum]